MIDGLLIGLGVGVLSGLLGIGGGPILIPLLLYVFSLDMQRAAGTSLAIIIPTALVGVVSHYAKGHVNLPLAFLIASGGMIGAFLGSQVSGLVPGVALKKLFAILLLYIAVRMFFDV